MYKLFSSTTMLSRRCYQRLIGPSPFLRNLHITPSRRNPENPSPATSTSAAQPFSTPLTPSPSKTLETPPSSQSPSLTSQNSPSTPPSQPETLRPSSSMAAGAILRGMDWLKNKDPPRALEDNEYPPWLWTLLDPPLSQSDDSMLLAGGSSEGAGDAFAKSKKQRRLAAKAARAREATMSPEELDRMRYVPLHAQSVDLPSEGEEAIKARGDLKTSLRAAGRKKIKEQNFLKGMG